MLMRRFVPRTVPIALGAIANRTRSSTPLLSSITARPSPSLSSLRAPPRIFITPLRPHSFSRRWSRAGNFWLALPCLASPRLASPRLDSTQLDSLRFVSFRFVSPASSLERARDPKECNSYSLSSDSSVLDKSRVIFGQHHTVNQITSGNPHIFDCFRIVNFNSLGQSDFSFSRRIVAGKHCLPTFYVCSSIKHWFHWSKTRLKLIEKYWNWEML